MMKEMSSTVKLEGKWLFDTNLLVYGFDETSPHHQKVVAIFEKIDAGAFQPVVSTQNITEVVNVFYRTYKQPLGKIVGKIKELIEHYAFEIISPRPTTPVLFFNLISSQHGKISVYDTFLAATMLDNGVPKLVSFNDKDFTRFDHITVVNPSTMKMG